MKFFLKSKKMIGKYRSYYLVDLENNHWQLINSKDVLDDFPNKMIFEQWLARSDFLTDAEKSKIFKNDKVDWKILNKKFNNYLNKRKRSSRLGEHNGIS